MASVREIDFGDLESVGQLNRSVGWDPPTRRSWERLWDHNPSRTTAGSRLSKGWILEEDGKRVGCLLNLTHLYQLGDRTLRAAVAASFVVASGFRGSSMQLALAFVKQTGPDLLLNTTAATHVSPLFQFLKLQVLPQPDYSRKLYWVLQERGFLNASLRKKGFSQVVSHAGSMALAPALWAEATLRRRHRVLPRSRFDIRLLTAEQIDKDFDDLWERKLGEGLKLLAHRTAETLRWHCDDEGRVNPPFLLATYQHERLVGYLGVVRQDALHLGLKRARVADIFVEQDDPEAIRALLIAAMHHARQRGAHMLAVVGFPESIRRCMVDLRPFETQDDFTPFLFRAIDPKLHEALSTPEVWYASLYDGDGSL
jgi:hypothetical protein